jgi:hypothetical protein
MMETTDVKGLILLLGLICAFFNLSIGGTMDEDIHHTMRSLFLHPE